MRALLEQYGFTVQSDSGLATLGHAVSPDVGKASERVKHLRIVVADKPR